MPRYIRSLLLGLAGLSLATHLLLGLELSKSRAASATCTFTNVSSFIRIKWDLLNSNSGPLGCPSEDSDRLLANGRYRIFEGGRIYWRAGSDEAFALYADGALLGYNGMILRDWLALWNRSDVVPDTGYPISDETPFKNGRYRYVEFENAIMVWDSYYPQLSNRTNGSYKQVWSSLGGVNSWLGFPIDLVRQRAEQTYSIETGNLETITYDSQSFENGEIIFNPIEQKYYPIPKSLEINKPICAGDCISRVDLGLPKTNVISDDGRGTYYLTTNGGVYSSSLTGVSGIFGRSYNRWLELGGREVLGYPTGIQRWSYFPSFEPGNDYLRAFFQFGTIETRLSGNLAADVTAIRTGNDLTVSWHYQPTTDVFLVEWNDGTSNGRGSVYVAPTPGDMSRGTHTFRQVKLDSGYNIRISTGFRWNGTWIPSTFGQWTLVLPSVGVPPSAPIPNPNPDPRPEPSVSMLPDLMITKWGVNPPYPLAGTSYQLNFEITNIGAVSSGAFEIALYLDGSLQPVGSIQQLPNNQSVTYSWFIGASDDGIHGFTLIVDSPDKVREDNETNNTKSGYYYIAPPYGLVNPLTGGEFATDRGFFEIRFPPNAVSETTQVTYTRVENPMGLTATRVESPKGLAAYDQQYLRIFAINAYDPSGKDVSRFLQPYAVSIGVDEFESKDAKSDLPVLQVAMWDETGKRWLPVVSTIDNVRHRLMFGLDRPAILALVSGVMLPSAYLPLVAKQPHFYPDLVANLSISPDKRSFTAGEPVQINVTFTNTGSVASGPFWSDLYINPSTPPTGPNLRWNVVCGLQPCFGLAWFVDKGLAPGESITLTSTVGSYADGQTIWPGWFASGSTDLYLYVDSWRPGVSYGAVRESDEANNLAQVRGLSVIGINPLRSTTQQTIDLPPRSIDSGR